MAKILLVEDDNNLREIYEARLQAEGYEIVSAINGEEALVIAKKERPDLIISDVMMPRISGFEMLDILKNTEGLHNVKTIMLTALGQAEDKSRADSLGADRYLVKSQVTLEDIVRAAHELLEPEVSTTAAEASATPVESASALPTPAPEAATEATTVAAEQTAPAPEYPQAPEVMQPAATDTHTHASIIPVVAPPDSSAAMPDPANPSVDTSTADVQAAASSALQAATPFDGNSSDQLTSTPTAQYDSQMPVSPAAAPAADPLSTSDANTMSTASPELTTVTADIEQQVAAAEPQSTAAKAADINHQIQDFANQSPTLATTQPMPTDPEAGMTSAETIPPAPEAVPTPIETQPPAPITTETAAMPTAAETPAMPTAQPYSDAAPAPEATQVNTVTMEPSPEPSPSHLMMEDAIRDLMVNTRLPGTQTTPPAPATAATAQPEPAVVAEPNTTIPVAEPQPAPVMAPTQDYPEQTASTELTPPPATTTTTEAPVAPAPQPQEAPDVTNSSAKKIIAPISPDLGQPDDLTQLLANEGITTTDTTPQPQPQFYTASPHPAQPLQPTPATQATPGSMPPQAPPAAPMGNLPPAAHHPGQVISPNDGIDPNRIAL